MSRSRPWFLAFFVLPTLFVAPTLLGVIRTSGVYLYSSLAYGTGGRLLSIPWQKPPPKRFREILLPHGSHRNEVRPERPERRLRLVNAIARGRRWLDEIVSGTVTSTENIASRERCSVRHVNMTISLAFLAPQLVRAAVEGRLPHGINIERLRDAPAEWNRQFEALGLKPQ